MNESLKDLLKDWGDEPEVPVEPPPEIKAVLDRIGGIMTTLCEPLGGSSPEFDIVVRNIDAECTKFMVSVPWGNFVVYDNGHEDHWSGGIVESEHVIKRMSQCLSLHSVLRLHLMICIDETLAGLTEYLDDAPPPKDYN